MTTLFWRSGANDPNDRGDGRVIIEEEDAVLTPELKKRLGKLDGLRGGPDGARGEYDPIRPEHSQALREEIASYGKKS